MINQEGPKAEDLRGNLPVMSITKQAVGGLCRAQSLPQLSTVSQHSGHQLAQ